MDIIELDNSLIERIEMLENRFNITLSNFLIQFSPNDLNVYCDAVSNSATNETKQVLINAAIYDQNNNILAHSIDAPVNRNYTNMKDYNKFSGYYRYRMRFFSIDFDISEIKRILVFPSCRQL